MKLNQDFEMAVAAIEYLKENGNGSYIQSGEIAKKMNFSPGYLHKVVLKLGRSGIMECKRGATGGLKLKPGTFTLLDVWKSTYGHFDTDPDLNLMQKPLKAFAEAMDKVVVVKHKK